MHYARLARVYWWLEALSFGGRLKQARLWHLGGLKSVKHALLLGEGNGSFLVPFVRRYPNVPITVVDQSCEMLDCARRRLQAAGLAHAGVHFIQADAAVHDWPEAKYDLLVSHFFFDSFLQSDMERIFAKVAVSASPEARWLVADFQIPEGWWRRLRARAWLWVMYAFFGRVAAVPARALPTTELAMQSAGYQCVNRVCICGDLIFSAVYRKC